MNTISETTTKEDSIESSEFEEPLDKGLLSIFHFSQPEHFYTTICPEFILREAHLQCQRVVKDMLNDQDFHETYELMKQHLGSYFAASICMMMLYAMMGIRENLNFCTLCLMHKIENKYRLRPWMKDVEKLVYRVKHHIHDIQDTPIVIKLEDNSIGAEKKELNITLNINNEYTGEIKQIHVAHSDVTVGVAENGSNVFHHKEEKK